VKDTYKLASVESWRMNDGMVNLVLHHHRPPSLILF